MKKNTSDSTDHRLIFGLRVNFPDINNLTVKKLNIEYKYPITVAGKTSPLLLGMYIKQLYEKDLNSFVANLLACETSNQKIDVIESLIISVDYKITSLVSKLKFNNKKYTMFVRPEIVRSKYNHDELLNQENYLDELEPYADEFQKSMREFIKELQRIKHDILFGIPLHPISFTHLSFKYINYDKNPHKLNDGYNSLKKLKLLNENDTPLSTFHLIFSGKEICETGIWHGNLEELYYFIFRLRKAKKIYPTGKIWIKTRACFNMANRDEIIPQKFKGLHKPALAKSIDTTILLF